jgi:tetratricopeptide (TPR) repeat protein
MIAMERDNLPYAMDMFMAALDIEPRFLKARKFLRAAGMRKAQESKATPLTQALSTLSGLPGLLQGHLALKTGKPLRALHFAEQLMQKDAMNLVFIDLLCRAAEAASLPEAAIQALVAAREFYPTRAELIAHLGNLYTATDQMDAARECFEAVVDLRPHDAKAMKDYKDAMARDSMIKGGWTEAAKEGGTYRSVIKDLKEAATLEQETKSVHDAAGLETLIQNAIVKIKQEPDNVNHRRTLANLYVEANRFEDAIRAIQESRRIPGIDDAQLDQTLSEVRRKQFDGEIEELRRNGDLRGAESKLAEKNDFLFKDVKQRVERYPNDLQVRFDYGMLLFEREQINEAIQQFQLAQRYPRNRLRALYYLGLCFRDKQQLDLAREQLEKAAAELTTMNELKKDIFSELGGILERMGNFQEAADLYYKAIYQVDIGYKDVAAKIEAAYKTDQP